jgi:hypothetical protein
MTDTSTKASTPWIKRARTGSSLRSRAMMPRP